MERGPKSHELEMWSGLECTINRIADRYVSQSEKNGHSRPERLEYDLAQFAELGVKRIRYPALWEQVAPSSPRHYDWSSVDRCLELFQKFKLQPIVGLLHHGSGPRYTSLVDPEFSFKFADYAAAFAERYPWVTDYTPINEILTTSLFSCLYGHWYPHKKDDFSFISAVYNQVKATILAMEEIRQVNPQARLIQTEDLGRVQSTEILAYQAQFQNERRWLSFDMLSGKLDTNSALAEYLFRFDFSEEQMLWLKENACPPDILGINHYRLSSRYLDHRLELFAECFHGGNGIHRYADVATVDTPDIKVPTAKSIFKEVWDRYHRPIAITEAHQCGHREDQMRWLKMIWQSAKELREEKVDIRAVTAWSLLGSYDWHRLCTVDEGFYEPGIFDLRTSHGWPKKTIISHMVSELAQKKDFSHPLLEPLVRNQKILITGGRGTLGKAFARICEKRNIPYYLCDRSVLDIADPASVRNVMLETQPWAVINTAGYVKVDQAENEDRRCFRENVDGALILANWCADYKIPFVSFSSDLVFDGKLSDPYNESHEVSPLGIYGKSKAQCEKIVLDRYPEALIVRSSAFFGPWDEANFITTTLHSLIKKEKVSALSDTRICPTYIPDLVNTVLDLLIDKEKGLIHLCNKGSVTWAQFAKMATEFAPKKLNLLDSLIIEMKQEELKYLAPRPKNSALVSERVAIMPPLTNSLERYFSQLEVPL